MFRKESHKTMMPDLVVRAYRPDYYAALQRRSIPLATLLAGAPRGPNISKVTRPKTDKISLADVLTLLREKWENATMADAEATVESLMASNFLKVSGTSYRIIPECPIRGNVPTSSFRRNWKEYQSEKHKGKCPTCGFVASNKNRHSNSEHRETECKENQIRSVMNS